jgi:hypothetical protein
MSDETFWADTLLIANEADAGWLPDIPDVQTVFNGACPPGMFYRIDAPAYIAGRRRNPSPDDTIGRMEITLCRLIRRRRANLKLHEDVEGRVAAIDTQIAAMRLKLRELHAIAGHETEDEPHDH